MARKPKQEEGSSGAPEWMSTYGDLVTLLLTFFVLLFAMSSVDAAKFNALASSFASRSSMSILDLGNGGSENVISEMMGNGIIQFPIPPNDILPDVDTDNDITGSGGDADLADLEERRAATAREELSTISDDLRTYFAESFASQEGDSDKTDTGIEIEQSDYYITIKLEGGVTFESGTHTLTQDALAKLATIADVLQNYPDNEIEVEGHTDTRPINTVTYPSNYVLSARRAIAVTEYLAQRGLDNFKIKPVAQGEFHPVADNNTEEGRQMNRRVEIKVYSQVYTGKADALIPNFAPPTDEGELNENELPLGAQ